VIASDNPTSLPEGFEDLEPHVTDWALPTEETRYAKRIAAPMADVKAFYDTMQPRMEDVMRHLAAYPASDIASLPAATRRLYRLAQAYFEASHPIELNWRSADLGNAFPADRIQYQGPSRNEN
jgi:hypothetical protein